MIGKQSILTGLAAMLAATLLAQGPSIQNRVDRLATVLNLTDAQKTNATAIFTDALTAGEPIQSSLHDNRQALADAIKKNDTAAIATLAAAAGTLSGQLTAINARADAAFYAILTADQQAKYDALPHGGPGGPGGGPGFAPGRSGSPRQ